MNYSNKTVSLWHDCLISLDEYKNARYDFIHIGRDYSDFVRVYDAWTGLCSNFGGFANSVLKDNPAWFTHEAGEIQKDMLAAINDGNELMAEIRTNYSEYVDRYYDTVKKADELINAG